MEDRALDLIIGEGPSARSVRIDLPPFTLIGATTRQGLLQTPLRDRFGIPVRLQFYTVAELERVVTRGATLMGVGIDSEGAREIAKRARGTPRVAGRLLRRVRDFAQVMGDGTITRALADQALTRLEVDALGLDLQDRRYLMMIADIYKGGPVGVETLAAGLSEPRDTIEEVIEPYLIQLGLVARTARGRCLNDRAWQHLGITPPTAQMPGGLPARCPACSSQTAANRPSHLSELATLARARVPDWDRVNTPRRNATKYGRLSCRFAVNVVDAAAMICVVQRRSFGSSLLRRFC
jgi:Holliday junction DNA helicase RuvB